MTGPDLSGAAASDEMIAVCADGLKWLERHPSPVSEAGDALGGIFRTYAAVARTLLDYVEGRGTQDGTEVGEKCLALRGQIVRYRDRFTAVVSTI